MAFCDFCQCESCQEGNDGLSHAQTASGIWICSICYDYDQCTSGPNRNINGPCSEKNCAHRPVLISDWVEFINEN